MASPHHPEPGRHPRTRAMEPDPATGRRRKPARRLPEGGADVATPGPCPEAEHPALVLQRAVGNVATVAALGLVRPQRPDPPRVQSHLRIGAASDPLEREADQVADDFTGCRPGLPQRSLTDGSPEPDASPVRRVPEAGGREPIGPAGGTATPTVERAVRGRADGRSLEANTRARFESFFGADLGSVRIHTGEQADRANREIGADAFTSGTDVFFARNAYRPGTSAGDWLLAHELTHAVQQAGDRLARGSIGRARPVQRGRLDVIRRGAYQNLQPTQRRQVDAKAEADYQAQANEFEDRLGHLIANSGPADAAAAELSRRVRRVVDAWAGEIKVDVDQVYLETYGTLSPEDTGSVAPLIEDIRAVLDGGTLRERLALIYSAIRSGNLDTMLQAAYHSVMAAGRKATATWADQTGNTQFEIGPGLPKRAGLEHLKPWGGGGSPAVVAEMGNRIDTTQPVNQRSRLFDRGPLLQQQEASGARQTVQHTDDTESLVTHQTLEDARLTDRELRNQVSGLMQRKGKIPAPLGEATINEAARKKGVTPRAYLEMLYRGLVKQGFSDEANQLASTPWTTAEDLQWATERSRWLQDWARPQTKTPTQWAPGEQWYRIQVDSEIALQAAKVKAGLRAGISGSTDMFLHAAQYLGMDKKADLEQVRLAMLGWMLPARDHSFYEIMMAGTQYGLDDFNPKRPVWEAYERPINPLPATENQRAIPPNKPLPSVPNGKFPGWYLSPAFYQKSNSMLYRDLLAQHWLPQSGVMVRGASVASLVAAGAPAGIVEVIDDQTHQHLVSLLTMIQRATFGVDPRADLITFNGLASHSDLKEAERTLGGNADVVFAAMVAKTHPGFQIPDGWRQLAVAAKILVPAPAGARLTGSQITAFDPDTSPALKRPDIPSAGSGKRMTAATYEANKQQFIENVLQYDPAKYRADPTAMDAWFDTYGRRMENAFPRANLDLLRTANQTRLKAAVGSRQRQALDKTFDDLYQKVFGLEQLTEQEKIAINAYTVSAGANAMNDATLGDLNQLERWGDTIQLLVSGLEKLPPYTGGPVYRGGSGDGYRVGQIIHFQQFVSTSKTVTSSFANRPGKAGFVIDNHRRGKDIMALSEYSRKGFEQMEGEVLFPPGCRFVVKRVDDWTGVQNPFAVIDDQIKQAALANNVPLKQQLQQQRAEMRVRQHMLNRVWVHLDEV